MRRTTALPSHLLPGLRFASRTRWLAALLVPLALVCVGCDRDGPAGTVRVDGSSTVFPISEAAAEEFSEQSDVRVNVGFSGTGGGIDKFCRGEIDIANASRAIRESELAACAERGIDDVVEIQVAIDALTVMVHPANTFADCMTVEELHTAFKAGGATTWRDIRPEWPAEPLVTYYPGVDSGTFDYFVEAIIEGVDESASHRGDGTSSEDDNLLLQGISNDVNAIGYFGFAYFLEAGDQLKPVAIDSGEGCVEPSVETALSGEYRPLSRPLFIYTRGQFLAERPEVLQFVDFYLSHAQELVPEVGYVRLPDDLLQQQRAKIEGYLEASESMARASMAHAWRRAA